MQKFKNYHEIVLKLELETDVGKLVDLVDTTVISVFQDMSYVKWHINVYYQV